MNTRTKSKFPSWNHSTPLHALPAVLLLWVATAMQLPAAPGDVDLSFDPGSAVNGYVRAIKTLNSGKVLIGGGFSTFPGGVCNGLACLQADGARDQSFQARLSGTFGDFSIGVTDLGVQSDGKILMAGIFSAVNGLTRSNLARLTAEGALDTTFLAGMTGPNGSVSRLLLLSDGRILISGSFTTVNGIARPKLARLYADGSLDTSFLNGLAGPNDTAIAMEVQSDGKILIAGGFTAVNGSSLPGLARLNVDGSVDATFQNGLPAVESHYLSGLVVQGDGRIVVAGAKIVDGLYQTELARLNPDGSLDTSFQATYHSGSSPRPPTLALQPDGKILIAGGFRSINNIGRTNLARINADGTLDESFFPRLPNLDYTDNAGVFALCLLANGKLLIGGTPVAMASVDSYVIRLNGDGSADSNFSLDPTGPNGAVHSVALEPDGATFIGGAFTSVGGVLRGRVARLKPDGTLDNTYLNGLVGANDEVFALARQSDGRLVLGGEFSQVNGVAQRGIVRLNVDGSLDSSFASSLAGYGRYVLALAVQGDGKVLLAGSFTNVNGWATTNVARLNPDGSADPTFATSAYGSLANVNALILQTDGKIVIGGFFATVNGVVRNRIARLNSNGSLDNSFLNGSSGADQAIWALALQADGKILVGGWFENFNGVARKNLVRLHPNGSVDTSFLPGMVGPNGGPSCLAMQPDGKILMGGGFSSVNGITRGNLARLLPNGSVDSSFLNGLTGAAGTVSCLALLPDSKLVIGGDFRLVNQVGRSGVARLFGDYRVPDLVASPLSQTVEEGGAVRLFATVTNTPAYFQWFFNETTAIGGPTTNSSLVLSNLQSSSSGAYTVVVTNVAGAVTSTPAMLSVIPRVERRPVPGVLAQGEVGSSWNMDCAETLGQFANWQTFDTVELASGSGWCLDVSMPLPVQRFYRAWQTGASSANPTLTFHLIPGLTLTGDVGSQVRVDGINQFGPTDAWFTLDMVTLTNTTQLYFDVSVVGQPARLYRLVPIP